MSNTHHSRESYTVTITATIAVTTDKPEGSRDQARKNLMRDVLYDMQTLARPGVTAMSTDIQITELLDPWQQPTLLDDRDDEADL